MLAKAFLGLCTFLLVGCATMGTPESKPAGLTLVYLKTGPKSATNTPEQQQEIFAGHMANMKAMADAGDLVIAGPFGRARDKSWRGIFVFSTPDVSRAEALVATDPGIVAGEFVAEIVRMKGSKALLEAPAVEKQFTANLPPPKPEEPPKNIRGYVMVTAEDADLAAAAMEASPVLKGKVTWCARLEDGNGGWRRGLFIVDAEKPADVSAALEPSGVAVGVDPWWSTASLPLLPADVRRLP